MIKNPNSWFTDSAISTFGIPTQMAIRRVQGWLSGKHKTVRPEDIQSFDKAVEYARSHCVRAQLEPRVDVHPLFFSYRVITNNKPQSILIYISILYS